MCLWWQGGQRREAFQGVHRSSAFIISRPNRAPYVPGLARVEQHRDEWPSVLLCLRQRGRMPCVQICIKKSVHRQVLIYISHDCAVKRDVVLGMGQRFALGRQ